MAECVTCGDPQSQHKGGTGGCRRCEFGCDKFVPEALARVATTVQPVPAEELEAVAADTAPAESAEERLARAELHLTQAQHDAERLAGERDLAKEQLNELRTSYASLEHLAKRMERAAGCDEGDPFEDAVAVIEQLRTGRNEATERALELAAELAGVREQLTAANRDGNQMASERDAARADLADAHAELKQAREEIADCYLRLSAAPEATEIGALLDKAAATQVPAIVETGGSIRDLISRLREQLAEHEHREGLRAELSRIEERRAAILLELGQVEAAATPDQLPAPDVPDRAVREWAKGAGFDVDSRGRVSWGLRAAYVKAHSAA